MGTSMPEFLVSLVAALKDKTDFALGNIVGSNIANIGLILGVSALSRPMAVNAKLLKVEIPLVIFVSILFALLCLNGELSRLDGALLVVGFSVYMYLTVRSARKEINSQRMNGNQHPGRDRAVPRNLLFIVLGIVVLSFGADWTISSAAEICRRFNVSELILGLTVVAVGTSLPELATSVVAAAKHEGDISIGNIIGSNLFNIMAIAGPTAVIHPLSVSSGLITGHIPIMIVLTILTYLLLRSGKALTRFEGAVLLVSYVSIVLWWII
jgi:cation:H+ antiporter